MVLSRTFAAGWWYMGWLPFHGHWDHRDSGIRKGVVSVEVHAPENHPHDFPGFKSGQSGDRAAGGGARRHRGGEGHQQLGVRRGRRRRGTF